MPPDATLVRRRLGSFNGVVCGAPAYLERHPAPQSPADLAGHNCLRYPHATPFRDEWHFLDPDGNRVVTSVSGSVITNGPEIMRAAAEAGIGLVLAPPFMVADLLASGALVPLLPEYQAPDYEINAFYPHRRHLSAKVRTFIDMLVDQFAQEERYLRPATA